MNILKASELITELQKQITAHGDLPVYYRDSEYGLINVELVIHEPKSKVYEVSEVYEEHLEIS